MPSFLLSTGEHIRKTLRPSKLALMPSILVVFTVVLLPLTYTWKLTVPDFLVKGFVVWTIGWCVWLSWKIVRWTLLRYILTTHRLIVIEHISPINKQVEETPLDRILNVGLERSGLLESVFGLGTVLVRVVGLEKSLKLRHLKNAPTVVRQLWEASGRNENGRQEMLYDRDKQYPI